MLSPELFVFAKAPVPGTVKTRLQPPLDGARAAQVAAVLITRSARLAAAWWPGEVTLCCAPDTSHPLFAELAPALHLRLAGQGPGDLGERMQRALAGGFERHGAAAVLGCDVPHLAGPVLEQAYEHLAHGRDVLGPAVDGGYYLIGLAAPCPALFSDMAWGTPGVLAQTRARAAASGRILAELPTWRDIDTWEDLCAAMDKDPEIADEIRRIWPFDVHEN